MQVGRGAPSLASPAPHPEPPAELHSLRSRDPRAEAQGCLCTRAQPHGHAHAGRRPTACAHPADRAVTGVGGAGGGGASWRAGRSRARRGGVGGTHRKAACPGPGRAGGRPWCRTCGRTAPAGRRRRSGSTRPLTACPPRGLGAAGSSSWPSCPCPRRRGTPRPGIRERQSHTGRTRRSQDTGGARRVAAGSKLGLRGPPGDGGAGGRLAEDRPAAVSHAPHPWGGECGPPPAATPPCFLSAAAIQTPTGERSVAPRAALGGECRHRAGCPPAFPSLLEPGGVTSLGNRAVAGAGKLG